MLRHVLFPGVLVDVADVVDGSAHGVDQGGAAAHKVLAFRHWLHFLNVHPVMEDGAFVGEQHGGNQCLSFFRALLFDHAVETADGILLQPLHGSALVQDEHHFCQILFHLLFLPVLLVLVFAGLILQPDHNRNGKEKGRPESDK